MKYWESRNSDAYPTAGTRASEREQPGWPWGRGSLMLYMFRSISYPEPSLSGSSTMIEMIIDDHQRWSYPEPSLSHHQRWLWVRDWCSGRVFNIFTSENALLFFKYSAVWGGFVYWQIAFTFYTGGEVEDILLPAKRWPPGVQFIYPLPWNFLGIHCQIPLEKGFKV